MSVVQLSRKLVLEQAVGTPDGAGGFVQGWAMLGTLWADLRPATGRSVAGEGVALSRQSYRITVRAAPQGAPSRPRPGQRLREGALLFLIDAVTEAGPGGAYLICHSHEEVAL